MALDKKPNISYIFLFVVLRERVLVGDAVRAAVRGAICLKLRHHRVEPVLRRC